MSKQAIALDTETTDLLAPNAAPNHCQPFITELSMIKFDLDTYEIIEEFNHLVNIPIPVPDHIIRITGITDEMLEGKPTFDLLLDEITEFCSGVDDVIGHNLMFDLEVIKHNFIRHNAEDKVPQFNRKHCTVEMSYCINKRRLKLGQLYQMATGKVHEGAHRARADVLADIECFKWLIAEGF